MSNSVERSYGLIPLLATPDQPDKFDLLLIQHVGDGSWGFPKGHPEDDDPSPLDAAIREVKEETGVDVVRPVDGTKSYTTSYYNPVSGRQKEVTLCPARIAPDQAVTIQASEIQAFKFVPLRSAAAQVTYQEDAGTIGALIKDLDLHQEAACLGAVEK